MPQMADDDEGDERSGIHSVERSEDEKRELYQVDMKEPRGEPPGLTYFSQVKRAVKEKIKTRRD